MSKLTHIELFAGCGGMNLGLEAAGFELYFANEISPMASETFAYNFFNENLLELASEKRNPVNTLWIDSEFSLDDLNNRLRENPFNGNKKYSDLPDNKDLKNKLLVGDIDKLLDFLIKGKKYKELEKINIDLVSGGPPCQSFSLAGKREKNNAKNLLPLSFAKFSGLVKPKVVLLENVKGITSPFTENGEKYYAWLEVSKAFVLEGYYPICMMINSKYFGVPQNRPRFIMLAYRKDIFSKLKKDYKDTLSKQILENTENFFKKVKENKNNLDTIGIKDFKYFDIENCPKLFNGGILPKITTNENNFVSVQDAIDDLLGAGTFKSDYNKKLETSFKTKKTIDSLFNFELRTHNVITAARFRFYQILEEIPVNYKRQLNMLLAKKTINEPLNDLFNQVKNFKFLIPDEVNQKNSDRKLKSSKDLLNLLTTLNTKKHSQRSLNRKYPAPAQLTIPDDVCHYDFNAPRVLTVREMARIQSFPDWFEFRSKVTTGGIMRKFETPQYTQVGNAVPPILSLSLGELIKDILEK